LSGFNETSILATNFRKIHKYQISRKSVQWEPICSMRTERQTDRRKWRIQYSLFAILRTRRRR